MRLVTDYTEADLSIVLVHGTWGRGIFPAMRLSLPGEKRPRWFEPGSRFRGSLKEQLTASASDLTYTVGTFEWSGSNSFIERAKAAEMLAARLDEELAKRPTQTQVLIGHSHGGSVCMLACKHLKVARPQIVTLATPFIELDTSDRPPRTSSARHFADRVREISLACFFYVYGMAWCGFIAGVVAAILYPQMPRQILSFPFTQAFYLFPYSWLHNPWLINLLPAPIGYVGYQSAQRWAENVLDPGWAIGGLIQVHPSISILVLRGVDDEATLALTAGAIGNRLSEPLSRLLTFGFLLTWALLSMMWLLRGRFIGSISIDEIRTVFQTFMPYIWLIDIFAGFCKSAHGKELFMWSLGLQIRSHSAPDHSSKLSVLTLPYRGRRGILRHAIYDHELVTMCIKRWIIEGFRLGPVEIES